MLSIILIGILIAVLVIAALAMLVFYEVAFANQSATVSPNQQWQPPLIRGKELRAWAAQMANAATAKWLSKPPSKATAIGLAAEISQGASFAIAHSQNAGQQLAHNCLSCKRRMIGVTPPETLAIAETIRETLPKHVARRVRIQSAKNAKAVADLDPNQYEQADVTCPLWDEDTSCLIFKVRPLHCRSCCPDSDHRLEAGSLDAHAFSVGSGTEEGLSSGLQSAGLDGSVYELNSALAAVLEIPNAAEQWIRGKGIFAQCKLCQ